MMHVPRIFSVISLTKNHKKINLTLRKIKTQFMVGDTYLNKKIERNKKVNRTSFVTFPGFLMEREGKTIISNIRESQRWKKNKECNYL